MHRSMLLGSLIAPCAMHTLRQLPSISQVRTACRLHTRRAILELCVRGSPTMFFHLMRLSSGLFRHVGGNDSVGIKRLGMRP